MPLSRHGSQEKLEYKFDAEYMGDHTLYPEKETQRF